MIDRKSKPLLFQQFIEAIHQILFALSNWVLLTSFLEANWWHFVDPLLTGISFPAITLLFATVLIAPSLLGVKTIRCYQPNILILSILRLTPSVLIFTVSLVSDSWKRTVILGVGIVLMPFSVGWILSKSPISFYSFSTFETGYQSEVNDKTFTTISNILSIEGTKKSTNNNFIMDTIFLAAVLLNMSVRYCCGSINAFYENWIISLFLLIFIGCFEIWSLIHDNKGLHFWQDVTGKVAAERNGHIKLIEEKNSAEEDKESQKYYSNSKKNYVTDTEDKYSLLSSKFFVVIVVSSCIQGFALGAVLKAFLTFLNTPTFLTNCSGNNYKYDWLIILFFTVGIICTLMVPPKTNFCYSSQVNIF